MSNEFDELAQTFLASAQAFGLEMLENLEHLDREGSMKLFLAAKSGEALAMVIEFRETATIRLGTADSEGNFRRAMSVTGKTPVHN